MPIRRFADICLASAGLLCLTPLMGAIALGVRIDSPGKALFHQRRIGQGGKPFYICKFRTMCQHHSGIAVSAAGDSRVTRLGRFLRKTKLDELPQLYNVLAGDMSFVGPRPEVPEYARLWPKSDATAIVSVKPGITDPVSIEYRNEADILAGVKDPQRYYEQVLLPKKAHSYAEYVRKRTLLTDLKVIVFTLIAVIRS